MTIAFVLGNGISRKPVELEKLQTCGPVYGCNALYREFIPNVLVATDKPISSQIQESGYSKKHKFYTRKPIPKLGALQVPEAYHGFSSGPIATAIAAGYSHYRIYMLGFDMGPTQDQLFNNMYAGTEFYKQPSSPPTFTGNWVKQIVKITSDYPTTEFIRIVGDTTAEIPELLAIKNLKHQPIATFLYRINNAKDL